MFSSFRFYKIASLWPADEMSLHQALSEVSFKPCGTFSENSFGFVPPVATEDELLCRHLAGCDLLTMRAQARVLPTAVVKEHVQERADAFEQRTGRKPSRKETRDLKDEVYAELLPKTLLKSDLIGAFYIHKEQVLAIATPTASIAETVLDKLREALGSLQATPLEFKHSIRELLDQVFYKRGPDELLPGRECRMKDPGEPKSSVNWLDMDLSDSSVRAHVKAGLVVDRLAVQFDTAAKFTVDEEIVIRKFKIEGIEALDEIVGESEPEEDPLLRHDAEFTLQSGTVTRVIECFKQNLGGYA